MGIDEVKRVAVLGAGTMGHGIAQVAALAGWDVALFDLRDELVARGLERIGESLEQGVARAKVTPADRDAARARLRGTSSLEEAAAGVDLVIEAVPEDLDLKRRTF